MLSELLRFREWARAKGALLFRHKLPTRSPVETREGKNVHVSPCCSGLEYERWKYLEKYDNERHHRTRNTSQYQARRSKNYERDDRSLLLREPMR
jgi:hypothetical protein